MNVVDLPMVAIVGRPNVGKSTLFNRLIGRRKAIVHNRPGVTRDRIADRFGLPSGRRAELVDTGGLVPGDDPLGLNEQVDLAIAESDVLLLLVDGREGLVAADEKVVAHIRKTSKPILVVVNKGDTHAAQQGFGEFYGLGLEHVILVSAEHGTGILELVEKLEQSLPETTDEENVIDAPALAVVGRPNVGKSSLVNRLLGSDRVLVAPEAGTTRDPIDSELVWNDRSFRLIDTAGIRRRSRVSGFAEDIAVMFARRQIERADLAVLVIDGSQGVTSGDLAIAGLAWDLGRPVTVAVNKWDLVIGDAREKLDESWPRLEEHLSNPARVNISALTGRAIDRLLPPIADTLDRSRLSVGTAELNRVLELALERHQAPQKGGRAWKLYYATQVSSRPPTFMLFANRTLDRSDTYRRYLENRLREAFPLEGVPVRLVIRKR